MFYSYNQNNSGGTFDFEPKSGISHWVIIEAASAEEADGRAKDIGLYFDGCETGQDCSCCGDRWSETYSAGTKLPQVYDEVVSPNVLFPPKEEGSFRYKWIKGPEGYIHYLNGTIAPFWDSEKAETASPQS